MGKAGSGKDTLLNALMKEEIFKDAYKIISCTTRPIREYEEDGVDYHFLTTTEFTNQILSGEMLEATVFNTWCYGTSIKIYVEANDKDRLLRQLNREEEPDCHEIVRRFRADEEDFDEDEIEFIAPDIFVTNNEGTNIKDISSAIAGTWTKLNK